MLWSSHKSECYLTFKNKSASDVNYKIYGLLGRYGLGYQPQKEKKYIKFYFYESSNPYRQKGERYLPGSEGGASA